MELAREKLKEALTALAGSVTRLFVPHPGGGEDGAAPFFREWDGAFTPYLDANAVLPPKEALFPRSEKLYAYDTKAGTVRDLAPDETLAIFGIRPCDVKGLENLDRVFLERGFEDSCYRARRDRLTTVALTCPAPAETCFCDSLGVSPNDAPGADVVLEDGGAAFRVRANTEKGEAALTLWAGLLSDSGAATPATATCALRVNRPEDLPERLAARFDDPLWEELSRACIGCGCCSFICPTCYCFDIGRENRGGEGAAFRCWDSCMFSDYSRMAGGHNPRPSKKERLRNRYMHKLSYFNERYGETLCVGCGRCVEKCPANLDITKLIERMADTEGGSANG